MMKGTLNIVQKPSHKWYRHVIRLSRRNVQQQRANTPLGYSPANVAIKNDPFEALNKHNNYLVEIVQTIIGQRQAPANLGKTKTKYFPQNTGH